MGPAETHRLCVHTQHTNTNHHHRHRHWQQLDHQGNVYQHHLLHQEEKTDWCAHSLHHACARLHQNTEQAISCHERKLSTHANRHVVTPTKRKSYLRSRAHSPTTRKMCQSKKKAQKLHEGRLTHEFEAAVHQQASLTWTGSNPSPTLNQSKSSCSRNCNWPRYLKGTTTPGQLQNPKEITNKYPVHAPQYSRSSRSCQASVFWPTSHSCTTVWLRRWLAMQLPAIAL